ncbi:MAG: Lpg1974 family pore-forming outer membrane protein [Nodosilinea sp.]
MHKTIVALTVGTLAGLPLPLTVLAADSPLAVDSADTVAVDSAAPAAEPALMADWPAATTDPLASASEAGLMADWPIPARASALPAGGTGLVAQATPSIDSLTEEQLRQRLQELETRQESLEQELDALRQLLEQQAVESPTTEAIPVAAEAPAEETRQAVSFSAEAIYLRPRPSNLQDFAIVDPGTTLFGGGDVAAPEFDRRVGGRFRLGYQFPHSPISVTGVYTTFNSSGSSAVERPTNGFLLATLAAPVQNENADTASSTIGLTYDVTDVELAYQFPTGGSLNTRVFGGLRVANINQTNDVRYDGRDFTNGTVNVQRAFSGVGFRLGGEVGLDLGHDISLFGRAAGSLLLSTISTSQQETNNNGEDLIVNLNRTASDRVVPVLELATGIQWQPQLQDNIDFDFALGYEFQNWFNVADTARFVDSSGTGVITQDAADLGFSGFFLRLGVVFRF